MRSKKHIPTIFSLVGAIGVIVTAALTAKETPKALEIIESMDENATKLDVVKETWKCYLPAALTGAATIICIFGANGMNQKQKAALISAYTLLNEAYREYQAKAKEVFGEDAETKIRTAIAKEHFDGSDISKDLPLFYDECSGRYFNATMEDVIIAEYELNRIFAIHGWASVNDWYDLIGVDCERNEDEFIGWSEEAAENFTCKWIEFEHDSVTMDDGLECCIIHTPHPPTADFMNYY